MFEIKLVFSCNHKFDITKYIESTKRNTSNVASFALDRQNGKYRDIYVIHESPLVSKNETCISRCESRIFHFLKYNFTSRNVRDCKRPGKDTRELDQSVVSSTFLASCSNSRKRKNKDGGWKNRAERLTSVPRAVAQGNYEYPSSFGDVSTKRENSRGLGSVKDGIR